MTTKTPEEMAELEAQGPAAVKAYHEAEARNVFGHDFKYDSEGNPIEQGIGAPGRETKNHFASMRKNESLGLEEPGTTDREIAAFCEREPKRAKQMGLKPAPKAAVHGRA